MDYFHYNYQCPYVAWTDADRVCCDGGSRVVCPSVALARKYVQTHCADAKGWKTCSIAQMINESYERKFEIQKGVKEWQRKQAKNSSKKSSTTKGSTGDVQ